MTDTRVPTPAASTPQRLESRPRMWLVATALAVIPLGLLTRQLPGIFGDLGGGAMFTVLVGLIVLVITPNTRSAAAGTIALAISAAIEMFQATAIPAAVSAVFPPARWILGSTFTATDFAGYAMGAVLVTFLAASNVWGVLAARSETGAATTVPGSGGAAGREVSVADASRRSPTGRV